MKLVCVFNLISVVVTVATPLCATQEFDTSRVMLHEHLNALDMLHAQLFKCKTEALGHQDLKEYKQASLLCRKCREWLGYIRRSSRDSTLERAAIVRIVEQTENLEEQISRFLVKNRFEPASMLALGGVAGTLKKACNLGGLISTGCIAGLLYYFKKEVRDFFVKEYNEECKTLKKEIETKKSKCKTRGFFRDGKLYKKNKANIKKLDARNNDWKGAKELIEQRIEECKSTVHGVDTQQFYTTNARPQVNENLAKKEIRKTEKALAAVDKKVRQALVNLKKAMRDNDNKASDPSRGCTKGLIKFKEAFAEYVAFVTVVKETFAHSFGGGDRDLHELLSLIDEQICSKRDDIATVQFPLYDWSGNSRSQE